MAKRTRAELRQAVKSKVSADVPLSKIKDTRAGQALGGKTVKNIYKNVQQASSPGGGNSGDGDSGGGNQPSGFTPTWSPSDYNDIFSNIYGIVQTGQENLVNLQGQWSTAAATIGANAQVSAAGIRADADREVGRAYADAQKYSAELGLEGVKYGADKESEWRQAVANIEVKGKLDLQPIINAGLEKVAAIEAQASRDVAETTGKYSLESMKQRTAADKSIGKMQLAGSMYGLIGSVFG